MRKSLIVLLSLTAAAAVAAVAAVTAVRTGARPAVGACIDPLPAGGFTAYRVKAVDGNCLQG